MERMEKTSWLMKNFHGVLEQTLKIYTKTGAKCSIIRIVVLVTNELPSLP